MSHLAHLMAGPGPLQWAALLLYWTWIRRRRARLSFLGLPVIGLLTENDLGRLVRL